MTDILCRTLFTATSLALVTACGAPLPKAASTSAIPETRNLLLVVDGGFSSCISGSYDGINVETNTMAKHVVALREKLMPVLARNDAQFSVLMTCYRQDATIHYWSSDNIQPQTSNSAEDFADQVDLAAGQHGNPRIVVIGYSYGGWLSLKTVASLRGRRFIDDYVSIDPISRTTCTFRSPYGCTTAPADITLQERQQIKDNSGHWTNYYQNENPILHSSSISEADQNILLAATHIGIKDVQAIWNGVYDRISHNLYR